VRSGSLDARLVPIADGATLGARWTAGPNERPNGAGVGDMDVQPELARGRGRVLEVCDERQERM
jgi:hypothetical protein